MRAVPDGYEPLTEQASWVRWLGRRAAENQSLTAVYPQFLAHEALTAPRAGVVLVTHVARTLTPDPRQAFGNFSLGNLDDMDRHLQLSFGKNTWQHMVQAFTCRPLGNANAQFLANQLWRVLRFNFPEQASNLHCDKTRLHRERPFKQLTRLSANQRCKTLASLAWLVGTHYLEAQNRL
jgi:hypothetical protein